MLVVMGVVALVICAPIAWVVFGKGKWPADMDKDIALPRKRIKQPHNLR